MLSESPRREETNNRVSFPPTIRFCILLLWIDQQRLPQKRVAVLFASRMIDIVGLRKSRLECCGDPATPYALSVTRVNKDRTRRRVGK